MSVLIIYPDTSSLRLYVYIALIYRTILHAISTMREADLLTSQPASTTARRILFCRRLAPGTDSAPQSDSRRALYAIVVSHALCTPTHGKRISGAFERPAATWCAVMRISRSANPAVHSKRYWHCSFFLSARPSSDAVLRGSTYHSASILPQPVSASRVGTRILAVRSPFNTSSSQQVHQGPTR